MAEALRHLMHVGDYQRIHATLDSPSVRVIADICEFLHPHQPAAHPDFPTPTRGRNVVDLLESMELRQRVLCGAIAFELADPAWQQMVSEIGELRFAHLPEVTVEMYRWIRGESIDAERLEALQESVHLLAEPPADFGAHPEQSDDDDDTSDPLPERRAYHFFMTVMHAVHALSHTVTANEDGGYVSIGFGGAELCAVAPLQLAIAHAARAADPDGNPADFLERWWRHCRCRLAWHESTDCDFS